MSNKLEGRLILACLFGLAMFFCFGSFRSLTAGFVAAVVGFLLIDYMEYRAVKKELMRDTVQEDTLYYTNKEVNVLWGTREQFIEHYGTIDSLANRHVTTIVRAATMTPTGIIYAVSPPNRHHDTHQAMYDLDGLWGGEHHAVEGFIDSKGNFHDREEAVVIARSADQLFFNGLPKTNPANELFSEDLW